MNFAGKLSKFRNARARINSYEEYNKSVSVSILTIVDDWGNQWAPGETSVPF